MAQMNDVVLRANDVGFRPMKLRSAQTESTLPPAIVLYIPDYMCYNKRRKAVEVCKFGKN